MRANQSARWVRLVLGIGGLLLWSVLGRSAVVYGQGDPERVLGTPVVRAISPQAYEGNGLVWDVAQGERGLLYIASSYGLQQYDGARWRNLDTGNRTTPFAVVRDSSGVLYVGAKDELGRYRPDSLGRLQYRSLRSQVPESHRPLGDVFYVVATEEAVFFHTESGVLRWAEGRMQGVTDTTTGGLFGCRGTAYLQDRRGHLQRVDGTALAPVAGGAQFEDATITEIIRGRERGCEVVTEEQGRFGLTETGVERRPLPGGPMDAPIVAAVRGPGGGLAVATEGTLRLIGPEGAHHRLTRASEQIPGEIKHLFVSDRAALWVATSAGIVRIAWPDPVSLATQPPALQSIPGTITRHEGALMLSTEQGLWRAGRDTIEHVASDGYVYSLLSTRAGLLAAGSEGLFVYRDGRVRFLEDEDGAYALLRSRRDSSIAYATLNSGGLLRLRRANGQWHLADRTDRPDTLIPSLAQAPDGALWMGTGHRGILRVASPREDLEATPIARYDTSDGLPRTSFNYTTQLGDSVRFPTHEGLYRFVDGHFEADPRFRAVYADGILNSWFAELGPDGGVWMDFGGHKLGVATDWPDDSLRWEARPFRRMADVGDVWSIYPAGGRDSLVWFGAEGALVRYDRRLQPFGGHSQPFRTLIRGVRTRDDSLLYGGDTDTTSLPAPVAYDRNRLRFQFGSTSFEQLDGPTHNWDRPRQYRWRLVGFDDEWTDWTTEAHADYTGLPPGEYTIRVEARNLYEVVGREATLSLKILPPWYRTWWAYVFYGLLAVAVVAGAVQWRTRQLRRRQEELEDTVAERTGQLRQKNDELARQAEALRELDEAKSRFFANLSHEFRTPLTLIRGPVQEVREQLARADGDLEAEAEQLAIAERNVDRLRRLVNQLLGLARMDAGAYELAVRPIDLRVEVQRIVQAFTPLAERHDLTLTAERGETAAPDDAAPVVADREALEHILGNLLSNAIKFTPEGGRVSVTVTEEADHVDVAVADTGPGIPNEQQDAVFERFQQGGEKQSGDGEGVGIGLAFTNDLVDLHGGTIQLESTEGNGTTVIVRFPRGTDHLDDDLIAVSPRPKEPEPTDSPEKEESSSSVFSPVSVDSHFSSPPSPLEREPAADTAPASTGASQNDRNEKLTVLVVDDNADVRRYVRSILTPTYAVIGAVDGEEGLARAREAIPDCILADVMMPEVDGIAMVRHLKADRTTAHIPVVMLTARAGTEHEVEGLEAGADDYVTKPFDADVLRARVAGMIEVRRRLQRRIREELRRRSGDGSMGAPAGGDRATGDQAPEAEPPRLVVPTASDDDPAFVREVRAAVEARLADPDLSVEQLASAVAVSRSTLYRRLKEQADVPPSQFIRQVRLEHGARLLREQEGTISEVAYAVGFSSLSYFSRRFRDHFGTSPSEYVEAVK